MTVLLTNDVCCSINSAHAFFWVYHGVTKSRTQLSDWTELNWLIHHIWRVLAKETIYIQEVNGFLIQYIPSHLLVTFAEMIW